VTHLIDTLVIPFLQSLYGAVGYAGVFVAMTIESATVPLPSELILPFAGFLVSDPAQVEPLTGRAWDFWITVLVGTAGNTTGSVISYAIGRYGGRPFLERFGRYLLIRSHDLDLAEHWFGRWGAPTAFFSRLLPIVRTFISFPAGVARMPFRTFVVYSTAGALPWSIALVWAGQRLGENWPAIRDLLAPFDLLIAAVIVAAVLIYVWWRLGRPGRGRAAEDTGLAQK
jgi:membrane protein DedA with SNARE-associated domain